MRFTLNSAVFEVRLILLILLSLLAGACGKSADVTPDSEISSQDSPHYSTDSFGKLDEVPVFTPRVKSHGDDLSVPSSAPAKIPDKEVVLPVESEPDTSLSMELPQPLSNNDVGIEVFRQTPKAGSNKSQRLFNSYFTERSALVLKLINQAVSSPIYAECKGKPFSCQIAKCRDTAYTYGNGYHQFGMQELVELLAKRPNAAEGARSCAYALATDAVDVKEVLGEMPIAWTDADFENALFLFNIASKIHPQREEIIRDTFEFSLYQVRGQAKLEGAAQWLSTIGESSGYTSEKYIRAKEQFESVQNFWSVWDVTERLGVNMGDPVILGREMNLEYSFQSGGRSFTFDDVIDRYYQINNAGTRLGRSFADAYWGNGFYAHAYKTDHQGFILIRVDRRSYEVYIDLLTDLDFTSKSERLNAVLDYGEHGNAHGYNWDAESLKLFLDSTAVPFHEWYDQTIPSAEFYSLSQRDQINIIYARQGLKPLPENWRIH